MTGFIITLQTRHFIFEAHGETEEQANELMGKALTRHAKRFNLPSDWWKEYEFGTTVFEPGKVTRDGSVI